MGFSNGTNNTNAQCKVVLYHWDTLINSSDLTDEELSATTQFDISSQITDFSYTKNMGQASGSFTIGLSNSPGILQKDWKDIAKRGMWVLVYLSNDGDLLMNPQVGPNLNLSPQSEAKRLRCIGYIERVGVKGGATENDAIDINFTITGRDFGVVYDQSEIWHNFFKFDKIMVEGLQTSSLNVTGNVRIHEALDLIHNLFYYPLLIPGAKVHDNKSLLSIGLQWLMPRAMCRDIGMDLNGVSRGTFWGNLPGIKDFSPTNAGIAVSSPADFLSGNAWEQLKRLSIPQFHELFVELRDDGTPHLVFRPIPWGVNQRHYPRSAKYVTKYLDIPDVITIPAVKLVDFDLAEDDHSRYNSFLATISTTMINVEDNVPLILGENYPKSNSGSIRRHGFRPMHVTIDSIVRNTELANGTADKDQLIEFNEILFDYWNNAVFAESGSVQIVGDNGIKVGKCLKFDKDVPYLSSKRYYIEGYADSFAVGNKGEKEWMQTVNVTRGFEEDDLRRGIGYDVRNEEFTGSGEYTPRGSNGGK